MEKIQELCSELFSRSIIREALPPEFSFKNEEVRKNAETLYKNSQAINQ